MKDVNSALSDTWRMLTRRCPGHEKTWIAVWWRSGFDFEVQGTTQGLICIYSVCRITGGKNWNCKFSKIASPQNVFFLTVRWDCLSFFIRIALYFVKINSWTSQLCSQDAEVSWKYISLCKETPHNTQLFWCERYFHRIIIWNFPYSYS